MPGKPKVCKRGHEYVAGVGCIVCRRFRARARYTGRRAAMLEAERSLQRATAPRFVAPTSPFAIGPDELAVERSAHLERRSKRITAMLNDVRRFHPEEPNPFTGGKKRPLNQQFKSERVA